MKLIFFASEKCGTCILFGVVCWGGRLLFQQSGTYIYQFPEVGTLLLDLWNTLISTTRYSSGTRPLSRIHPSIHPVPYSWIWLFDIKTSLTGTGFDHGSSSYGQLAEIKGISPRCKISPHSDRKSQKSQVYSVFQNGEWVSDSLSDKVTYNGILSSFICLFGQWLKYNEYFSY